ncbi:uncharacterized protein At4g26485-like [Aegilops tauschii subsp. strangulata]|uniref:uncharacterized protein At4g26485-like n=1 Tax=Aegilops tauschii subsp. strangulata TaxID=200361 RepID=UPI001ABC5713|nr:heavy metal-associated isoprenylated plant protein 41-like [Aegilops tauschii subsp. strangulata]
MAGKGVRWLHHYSSVHSILIVGDGDFSFSLSLAAAFGSGYNLVATSLDSYGWSILVVGVGDFSFSLALATAFGSGEKLVATSFDSYVFSLPFLAGNHLGDGTVHLISMYSKAESNVAELKRLGATVLHSVSVKKMKKRTDLMSRRFDRIVFNFPHAGFIGKENQVHMIKYACSLSRYIIWPSSSLVYFFPIICLTPHTCQRVNFVLTFSCVVVAPIGCWCKGSSANASGRLRPLGKIHVSHKTGQPYDRWEIEGLALEFSLLKFEMVAFRKEDYPGYNQKRGDGDRCDEEFPLRNGCTFKFQRRPR